MHWSRSWATQTMFLELHRMWPTAPATPPRDSSPSVDEANHAVSILRIVVHERRSRHEKLFDVLGVRRSQIGRSAYEEVREVLPGGTFHRDGHVGCRVTLERWQSEELHEGDGDVRVLGVRNGRPFLEPGP